MNFYQLAEPLTKLDSLVKKFNLSGFYHTDIFEKDPSVDLCNHERPDVVTENGLLYIIQALSVDPTTIKVEKKDSPVSTLSSYLEVSVTARLSYKLINQIKTVFPLEIDESNQLSKSTNISYVVPLKYKVPSKDSSVGYVVKEVDLDQVKYSFENGYLYLFLSFKADILPTPVTITSL